MATPRKPEDPKQRKLTPAQRLFADYVIEGRLKTESYRMAYPASALSQHALQVEASRTSALPHVAEYIAEALQERRREVLLTRDMKRQLLGSIAKDPKAPRTARIRAIEVDNSMTGDNAPVRVEGEITLHSIFTGLTKTTGLPAPAEMQTIDALVSSEAIIDLEPGESGEMMLTAMERAQQHG